MPAPFDFPFLPSVLPMGATGVSTGGDTAAPATGNAAATGTSDFASLLSGALTGQTIAPNVTAPVLPQTDNVQSGLPVAAPMTDAAMGAAQDLATPTVATAQPLIMPVNTTLLQAQLPAAETVMAPQDSAQTTLPEMVPFQTVVAQTAEIASAEIIPTEVPVVEVPAIKVPAVKVLGADTPTPAVAQADVAAPAPQAEPKAGPAIVQTPAPVMAAASAEPVVTSPAGTEVPVEVAPVVTPPVIKTVEAKPAKSKPVDAESSQTTVQTDETPAVTPDAASLAIVASVATPVTPPAVQPAGQPVVAGSDDSSTPVPAGRQKPAAPQAPAPQNQADAADEGTNVPADNTQTSAKPKFASLLTAAPAANASAAPKSQAPVTSAAAAIPSTPAASAPVQADASQTAKTVEAVPTQKPAVPMTPVQDAPVQTAQIQTAQTQSSQVSQASQASQAQTATRQPASAPIENKPEKAPEGRGETASTPVAAAPSGFSLVSAPVTADTTGYTPAATQAAPATSLLSQTAVDNINALSVQINRRNAEGATKFTMELHPADLGKVDVALSIGRDGKMTAHITFDSDVTAATFSAHESELRQQLRDTGLQLSDDALSFSTRQKTDAVAQAQAHTVNANARSADDSSSGNSGQQPPQNPFTQADSQQGQQRPHSQHLAQMARSQAAADQAAADADLEALNSAVDLAAARLNYRQSSSRLALDLSV